MQRIVIWLSLACASVLGQNNGLAPGEAVDLVGFGRVKGWPGGDVEQVFRRGAPPPWRAVREESGGKFNLGVEWDEPRQFHEIRVAVQGATLPEVEAEYWVSSWPTAEHRGGWTATDSPWVGGWRAIRCVRRLQGAEMIFRFEPLSESENPNAKNRPGWTPRFRRALKIRLRFSTTEPPLVSHLQVFGQSRWSVRRVVIESGCEGRPAGPVSVTAYNGHILSSSSQGRTTLVDVLHTEHEPDSNDGTILTVRSGAHQFGVLLDDVIREKAIYVRDAGIFVGDATTGYTFESYLASGRLRPGRDIHSFTARQEEQSLERATAEIPALAMTNRRPHRYVPLGFFGNREKYALLFNGSVFISKRESKLFEEEVAHMLWAGDTIFFRLGSGVIPDFRERERATVQQMLDDDLPIAVTRWSNEGIDYSAEAFATLIDAPLDPMRNRGDEPSILLMRLTTTNPGSEPRRAVLWLYIDPPEKLRIRGEFLEGTGDSRGAYNAPRFRAILRPSAGDLRIVPLPAEADYQGDAARWETVLAGGGSAELQVRLTLKTHSDTALLSRASRLDYRAARAAVISYWKGILSAGMRLEVPDEVFNRFHRAVLQHILLSVQRDVPTGLYMAPCGTLRYNMFANETSMLVRLLNLRGLHELAGKFLEPLLVLQGSKPFPGRFRQTDAIFHGVRVDPNHDYTHSGYNLNHGWTLWTAAEHYLFTRDKEWLRKQWPKLLKAANWIIAERKATMRTEENGERVWEYGLLPAGQLEDNEEWHYWFAVNAYAYRGLRAVAQAIADLDPAEAARLAAEADHYREHIRAAALRSMAAAPVAPLRDGTWVPVIPPRTALRGRDLGWIRNILYGALTLIDCDVFAPHEQVAQWILKDHEDNLFMASWSFSVPESDWFSRGGITLQPNLVNTPLIYLRRGEVAHALRPFYNTFAVSYYPDVNAFTEWVPSFGTSGGPFYKTSDEACFLTWLRFLLVHEDGESLKLAFGTPKRWFRTGKRIAVEGAATFFGPISYEIESRAADGYIDACVRVPHGFRGRRILLRVRHPDGKRIVRVEINSVSRPNSDPANDTIEIPNHPATHRVRVYY